MSEIFPPATSNSEIDCISTNYRLQPFCYTVQLSSVQMCHLFMQPVDIKEIVHIASVFYALSRHRDT